MMTEPFCYLINQFIDGSTPIYKFNIFYCIDKNIDIFNQIPKCDLGMSHLMAWIVIWEVLLIITLDICFSTNHNRFEPQEFLLIKLDSL